MGMDEIEERREVGTKRIRSAMCYDMTAVQGEHEHSLFLLILCTRSATATARISTEKRSKATKSKGLVSTHGFERSPHQQPSAQRHDPGQLPLVRKTDGETHSGAHAEPTEYDPLSRSARVDFVGDEFVDLVYGA